MKTAHPSTRPYTPLMLAGVGLSLLLGACGQKEPAQPPAAETRLQTQAVPVWTQVYADEFNGSGLDTSKWIVSNGAAGVNNELEYYTPEDVYVQGGNLVLRTQQRAFGGRSYSSGEVRTGNNVTVTRGSAVEWRTKVPKGKGIWPANWLVATACNGVNGCGSAWPPEIDVMEMRGSQPNINNMTHFWGSYPNQAYQTDQYSGPDFSQDFHTYRVEWLQGSITFYIDGVVRATHTANITDGTMQLVMNTAVGGIYDGNPDGSTAFPQYQLIDYVRVFKDTSGAGFSVPTDRAVQVVNRSSGKCLDVSGGTGATADNTPLVQWGCGGAAQSNQLFKFVPTDSGYYLLQAQHSGKIMAVTGGSTADGAPVAQWTYAQGSLDSQWRPVDVGGGLFKLVARHSGKVMDVPGCSAADGARMQQYTDLNNDCQKFSYRDVAVGPGPNLISNPGFDNGLTGWGIWSPNNAYQNTVIAETYNGRNGAHATEYSTAPYEVHTYQVKTGLASGNYTLRAWVRSTGGQSVGEMLVKNFGGNQISLDIRGYTGWTQVSIPNIPVSNGQAEIGFHTNAGAYQYLYFDDVEFFKQ